MALTLATLVVSPLAGHAEAPRPAPLPTARQLARVIVVDDEGQPARPAPSATVADRSQEDEASNISAAVFGSRSNPDYAYGAFQRGYYLTALDLALERAGKGDAPAQTLIGEIYDKGLGVAEDAAKAAGWFKLASGNGDPLAAFQLALMYQSGRGVPKDPQRAATLFEQAAAKGYPPAKYNLALLCIEGRYVKPDMRKAARLMKDAADAGLAEAQYDYGTMLLQGAGVPPDEKAAAAEIGMAAKQGLLSAEVDYATMLYLGHGVERDHAAAVEWYRKAARGGSPVAQNRYAKLLAVGEGVPLSLEDAAMWRALARRQGLNDPDLDKLLVSIPPDALRRAEERARYWPAPVPSTTDTAALERYRILPPRPLPPVMPKSGPGLLEPEPSAPTGSSTPESAETSTAAGP